MATINPYRTATARERYHERSG